MLTTLLAPGDYTMTGSDKGTLVGWAAWDGKADGVEVVMDAATATRDALWSTRKYEWVRMLVEARGRLWVVC